MYRNFSLRYLIDTKMVDVLSKDYKIILLTKNIYINYYKNYLNRNIEIIGYDWDKFEKLRKKINS